jgi:hypothetical protein
MAELRIPIIGEFKGKKAFDDANKSTSKLDKGVKKLAVGLIAAFSVKKIAQFGKAAAKAFIADEKAASQLAVSVKNLGLAFETPRIEEFISKLSQASGVADDVLRPSMQKLLQTTGSVTKSQELLTQALDISRGSGVDYETVVQDLTSAYVGQTRGLKKYSLGLSQAELKTMSFADVQEKLNKQFSGANEAYLDTFAGKMELLGTAAGEASEIIGKGLIDALMVLSGDTSVEDLALTMETLATNTSSVIVKIAELAKGVANFGKSAYGKVDTFSNDITDFMDRLFGFEERISLRNVGQAGRFFTGGSGGAGYNIEEERARRKIEADAAKRNKELAALQKKTLDTQKKALALQKAAKTLNLDAIGIEAALKGKISETDRISLLLQKAILEGNASLATQLSDKLQEAIKRNNELRLALLATPKAPNPFSEWSIPKLDFGGNVLGSRVPNFTPPSFMTPDFIAGIQGGMGPKALVPPEPVINIKVEIAGEAVEAVITNSQINSSLSGSFNQVNRSGNVGAVAIL